MRTNESKKVSEILKIGRHKYGALKGVEESSLSEEDKEQIKLYEEKYNIGVLNTIPHKKEIEWIQGASPTKKVLYHNFLESYRLMCGKDFIITNNTLSNLEPIIKYFSSDISFLESERLVKELNGKRLNPSLDKGLLIIGLPGNGKTSTMEVIQRMIYQTTNHAKENFWLNRMEWEKIRFLWKPCVNVVMEYESLGESYEKEDFFTKYGGYKYWFDDLLREETASNYGKKELFKDIITDRYNKKSLTHVTMNYAGKELTVESTLMAIGMRYGDHIFDRIFEMFNIIEFKGKSQRI